MEKVQGVNILVNKAQLENYYTTWRKITDRECSVGVMVFNSNFQQFFSYIVAICFIGGGFQTSRRIPLTCRKSKTNFIT